MINLTIKIDQAGVNLIDTTEFVDASDATELEAAFLSSLLDVFRGFMDGMPDCATLH